MRQKPSTETIEFVYNASGKSISEKRAQTPYGQQVSYLSGAPTGSTRVVAEEPGTV